MASELQQDGYYVEVTPHDLDVRKYIELVADDSVGAISTFNGVTRNNFMGKEVLRLEYEAYVPMAVKKLAVGGAGCAAAGGGSWGVLLLLRARPRAQARARRPLRPAAHHAADGSTHRPEPRFAAAAPAGRRCRSCACRSGSSTR
jgi:hypothetical protein